MAVKELNIVIGGEAGQGLVTIGRLLSLVLVKCGYEIVVTQSYQSRIRGGHNSFAVRVSTERVEAPCESIDLLVALSEETIKLHESALREGSIVVSRFPYSPSKGIALEVPLSELSEERYENVSALGVISSLLGLDKEIVGRFIDEGIGEKHPEYLEPNLKALEAGFLWAQENADEGLPLEEVASKGDRLMLNGNEAIAIGALSAGVGFCAFYPMTPATSIPLTLIRASERMRIVVEQAEDEISAINMALGASYAGTPAMVATSGGGFALMVEGVSLSAMTETPIVVVVAQRPGPATGLPTRTEQGDLSFVLNAGHGEFPRVIFAPGTVEECFELTRRAFFLAEKYQIPAFVLTDQFLSDSYRAVEQFALEGLNWVVPGADEGEAEAPYKRFDLTDTGVSPRLLPGFSEHIVVVDSDEHTEDGHLTEDLSIRKMMVEKRLKKEEGLLEEVLPPHYSGDDTPELLLVCWGSTAGSVREVAGKLKESGKKVAILCFSQLWPLGPDSFLPAMEGAGRVVCVEGNATGQFARLVRMVTGFEIKDRILRYDGLPITPDYILNDLGEIGIV